MNRTSRTSLTTTLVLAFAFASITSACEPRGRRDDWRHPGRPRPCSADTDCPGGRCVLEIGADRGACGSLDGAPLLGGEQGSPGDDPDGGPTFTPLPPVKPSPNDIQI